MSKSFFFFVMCVLAFLIYQSYQTNRECLDELSEKIATCTPHKCQLDKHPYAKTADVGRIYGFKKGKCLYKVNTGHIHTTCRFPKEMLRGLSDEFGQKLRVKKQGVVRKTRTGIRFNPKTRKKEEYPEILVAGRWEEYHQNLTKAMNEGICKAYDKKKKKKVK